GPHDDGPEADEKQVRAFAQDLGLADRDRLRRDGRQPEARVAGVMEREWMRLPEGGVEQRAELLLVLRAGHDQVRQLALGRDREHAPVRRGALAPRPRAT